LNNEERESEIEGIIALPNTIGGSFDGGYVHHGVCENRVYRERGLVFIVGKVSSHGKV
jgi:hypothetical protein